MALSVGNIISPKKVTEATLRALWVPHWETGQIVNAGCSLLTDWSGNGYDLTQSTGSAQPLWKQDTNYKGKWYVKFDGVDDILTNSSDPLTTNNGQIFIICRVMNTAPEYFGCSKLNLGGSSGTFIRVQSPASGNGLAKGFSGNGNGGSAIGSAGYSGGQLGAIFARKTSTSSNFITVNGAGSTSSVGVGDALRTSGIQLGGNSPNNLTGWYAGDIACAALFEGSDLTTSTLQGLLNWSKLEFEVYRDLMNKKL